MTAEKIFEILKDQAWHTINELTEHTGIETDKLIEYAQFLAKNSVAKYDKQNQKIKITPEWNHHIPFKNEL